MPRVSLALYPSAVARSLVPVSNQLNGNWAAGYATVASEQEAPHRRESSLRCLLKTMTEDWV